MRARHWAGWVVVGVIVAAGCTGGHASCPPPEPVNHRTSAAACPPTPTTETCSTDADCMGTTTSGKCAGGLCNYDACTTDADCGASGMVCSCAGQPSSGAPNYIFELPRSNVCLPGNCHVDADCGAGFFCTPSFAQGCPRALAGYYCHTCEDGCTTDSDCPAGTYYGAFGCMFDPYDGRWVCQLGGCGG